MLEAMKEHHFMGQVERFFFESSLGSMGSTTTSINKLTDTDTHHHGVHGNALRIFRRILLLMPLLLLYQGLFTGSIDHRSRQILVEQILKSNNRTTTTTQSRSVSSSNITPSSPSSSLPQSSSHIRLLVVSITGTSRFDTAMRIQDSWKQFLGPHDVVRTICDVGCGKGSSNNNNNNNSQSSAESTVVELDPELVNSIQRPRHFEDKSNPWGYRLAQLKFYFGLISQVQHFARTGNIPQWILIKDDDAYFHADRLMQLVEGVDFATEKVSLVGGVHGRHKTEMLYYPPGMSIADMMQSSDEYGHGPPPGCVWPSGGPGWLISQAMALELAMNRPKQVYDFMRQKLEHSQWAFHYDMWLPVIASWGGGKLYHSSAFKHMPEGEKNCFDRKTNITSFVSIHIKEFVKQYGLKGALARLEDCMGGRPLVPSGELLRERISQSKQQQQKNATAAQYCAKDKV